MTLALVHGSGVQPYRTLCDVTDQTPGQPGYLHRYGP